MEETLKPNQITAKNISKQYGSKTVLENISLGLACGECLSIFGANGAGKSTLLKILSLQTKATRGELFQNGDKIDFDSSSYRKKIGVISHQSFLYNGLTALENLMYYASLYSMDKPQERALTLLKCLEMTRAANEPVFSYSRGMLQRVSIARSLITEPKIIFLDEPYTGLDIYASGLLTELLKKELAKGTALVIVTHDLALGLELSSKIIVLAKGKISYAGRDGNIKSLEKFF